MRNYRFIRTAIINILFLSFAAANAQTDISKLSWGKVATGMPAQWYATEQAAEVAENVLAYQTEIGGWTKNTSYHLGIDDEKWQKVKETGIGATFDNDATLQEMRFLAKMYKCRKNPRYKEAFLKGLRYIFKAQYDNGGWPQFYPVRPSKSVAYSGCITFNDDAFVNIMNLLKDIYSDTEELQSLQLDDGLKQEARKAFDKGIDAILATQIIVDGERTVWCAQHDPVTLQPAKARAYELPSFSGMESASVTLLLMSLPSPSQEVIDAVEGAVKWFNEHKIPNMKYERFINEKGEKDSRLVPSPSSDLWARFYDLETGRPFFCDRDGIKRASLDQLGQERKGGYSWYGNAPSRVLKEYPKWVKKLQAAGLITQQGLPFSGKTFTQKPRILISTDIGGTDADDNQSMAHLLMMNERFNIEGLVSSPSFGDGSKQEILRMIDLYEKDYEQLARHQGALLTPDSLRTLCKQGCQTAAPLKGFSSPTEGSEWIVKCARKEAASPLWILVWGTMDDLAQALHDAPDIAQRIRVYWIGGPNKKWGVNSYTYIAQNYPDLWIIENNASYRGFIGNNWKQGEWDSGYYNTHIRDAGNLGKDFINYYNGMIKMGDTPSLLYMMTGDPEDPSSPKWGGQFERIHSLPYRVFNGLTSIKDTIPIYGVLELRIPLPKTKGCKQKHKIPFSLIIDKQKWDAEYVGQEAVVRYAPKAAGVYHYQLSSPIKQLDGEEGDIVVHPIWPGSEKQDSDLSVGENWYTDMRDDGLFMGQWQGAGTISIWRNDVLKDWSLRWSWLK